MKRYTNYSISLQGRTPETMAILSVLNNIETGEAEADAFFSELTEMFTELTRDQDDRARRISIFYSDDEALQR